MSQSFRRWLLPLVAASTLFSPVSAQTLNRDTQGRIGFASFTPRTMFDLARERRQDWAEQKVWGDLSLPKTAGDKIPVIVLMHGSGGVERGMAQWVDAFNDMGVATFVVYSFEPRGVKGTVDDQTRVPYAANLMDALQALQLLAKHPRIDESKIGVMGFSRGGSVAFQSALEPLRHAVVKSDLKFALHIGLWRMQPILLVAAHQQGTHSQSGGRGGRLHHRPVLRTAGRAIRRRRSVDPHCQIRGSQPFVGRHVRRLLACQSDLRSFVRPVAMGHRFLENNGRAHRRQYCPRQARCLLQYLCAARGACRAQ